jgi:sec-independent protein translocase protein TatA
MFPARATADSAHKEIFMAPSWLQILIVVVLLVLLFGRGKISELMGDVAKGIKSFKKGLNEEEETARDDSKTIDHQPNDTAAAQSEASVNPRSDTKAKAS